MHTDLNSFYKWTKILTFEITIFGLKMMVKIYFEIPRALGMLLQSAKKSAQKGWIGRAG